MAIQLEPSVIINLGIITAIVLIFAVVGLIRGWLSQLVILILIVSLWMLFSIAGDMLINFANNIYKCLFFVISCGMNEDTSPCLEASGVMGKILVDPNSTEQRRLFLFIIEVLILLFAYLLIMRFGKVPGSLRQRLIGALMGIATGFILIYLVLPFTLEQLALPLPEARLPAVGQIGIPLTVLILLVLFVIVAVRFIRPPPKKEEA